MIAQRMWRPLGNLIGEFRTFILRGNVIDLAVGVVIGAAFQSVVAGFVKDILTPLIAIPTHSQFLQFTITINKSTLQIGDFLNTLISFVLIAAVVFFLVVRPVNLLIAFGRRWRRADQTQRECPFCTSMISIRATRCPFCTADVPPLAAVAATEPGVTVDNQEASNRHGHS